MADIGGKKELSLDLKSRPGLSFQIDIDDPKDRIQAYMDSYKNHRRSEGFEEALLCDHLKLLSATGPPRVAAVFQFRVTQAYCNRMDNMHGAAIALLYDMCTTVCAAPHAKEGFWEFGGVSRVLSITYMRPTVLGAVLQIECEVLQVGARLATIRGMIKDAKTGSVLSVAEHNKVSVNLSVNPTKL